MVKLNMVDSVHFKNESGILWSIFSISKTKIPIPQPLSILKNTIRIIIQRLIKNFQNFI